MSDGALPPGFRALDAEAGRLLVDSGLREEIAQIGLQRRDTWDRLLRESEPGPGRGAVARCELHSGGRLVLKKLRRGGLFAPLWRDRFAGSGRLLDNLRLPREARARGVSTPAARALLSIEGPPGFYQGWLAVDEVPGARDLATLIAGSSQPTANQLVRVMGEVRAMHEAGVEHRDLNLGNLLVCEDARGEGAVFVTDLDGARLHANGLSFALRQRALRRLERSWRKLVHDERGPTDADWIYRGYAGKDAELADRLARGRRIGRLGIRLHRLGWGG